MSFLHEIIKSVEETEWSKLNERLPVLFKEIHLCKNEVFKILDEFYVEFTQKPVKIPKLADKLLEYQSELESLITCCEESLLREIPNSKKHKEYQELLDQANNIFQNCTEVSSCYCIHENFVNLRLYKNDCRKSLQLMEDIRDKIQNTKSQTLRKYYGKHFVSTESTFYNEFGEILSSKFSFGVKKNGSCSFLKVNNIDMEDLIPVVLKYSGYINQLDDLSDFVWEYVIVPIVTCGVVMTSNEYELKLKIMRKKEPYYKDVFTRLHNMCNFMCHNLNIPVDDSKDKTVLDYIGNRLTDRISSLIISSCFENILRNVSSSESTDYENIIQQVEALNTDLNRVKLVSNDSLIKYAEDLQQIYIKKNNDDLFNEIKNVMSHQNHDIPKVVSFLHDYSLSDLTCRSISSVAQELHQITEKILLQAKSNKLLINVLFDILHYFRYYTSKDILCKTPKEVALVHNNFIYIAHELRDWNILFSHIILEDKMVPLFKVESMLFQTVGEEILESFLWKEKRELEKHWRDLVKIEKISIKYFEQFFSKSLKVIDSLIEAWYDILPNTVFCMHIGVCMNALCSFLIQLVLNLETIDQKSIKKIAAAFINIVNVCEKYFLEEGDLKKFIKCWEQFKILTDILKSDIVEIQINKYHELLKLHYKAFDVKKIFKTIFEPSVERDALLLQLYD